MRLQKLNACFVLVVFGAILMSLQVRLLLQRQGFQKHEKENVMSRQDPFKVSKMQKQSDVQDGVKSAGLRQTKKFYMAFSYWEQFSMATSNLITLAALAVYSGRQVVMPFVHNSKFEPNVEDHVTSPTIEFYFNLTALNNKLVSYHYNRLASLETFHEVCQGKLDLLIYFIYGQEATRIRQERNLSSPSVFPCSWSGRQHEQVYRGFLVAETICVDVGILKSTNEFNSEVLKGSPCIGIVEWRGNGSESARASFQLPPTIPRPLTRLDISFFSGKLLEVAHSFSSKVLGSEFISVHLRTEAILYHGGSISTVVNCLKELATKIQQERDRDKKNGQTKRKVFVAADFSPFGSRSSSVLPVRKNSEMFIKLLNELFDNPVRFDPGAYNLVDTGAVAIVEMSILLSGSQFYSLGGGSFQGWIRYLFSQRSRRGSSNVQFLCIK